MSLDTFERLSDSKQERIRSVGIRAFAERSYQDVSTDAVTKDCGISKGILFHYFGSKKGYYLYCLEQALQCLTVKTEAAFLGDFYEVLFDSMNRKMALCIDHPNEMRMVNMASRDTSAEISEGKADLLQRYMGGIRLDSQKMLLAAFKQLNLREDLDRKKAAEGLFLYIQAVLKRYLLQYQEMPDQFFENREAIKTEIRQYLDLMLNGVCRKEEP